MTFSRNSSFKTKNIKVDMSKNAKINRITNHTYCFFDAAFDENIIKAAVKNSFDPDENMPAKKLSRINKILEIRGRLKTLEETGNMLGISRERVRQIEKIGMLRISEKYKKLQIKKK